MSAAILAGFPRAVLVEEVAARKAEAYYSGATYDAAVATLERCRSWGDITAAIAALKVKVADLSRDAHLKLGAAEAAFERKYPRLDVTDLDDSGVDALLDSEEHAAFREVDDQRVAANQHLSLLRSLLRDLFAP